MTPQQENNLAAIITAATALIEDKYRAGDAKHHSDLLDKTVEDLADDAIFEAIDQLVYLLTLKNKLHDIKSNLRPFSNI